MVPYRNEILISYNTIINCNYRLLFSYGNSQMRRFIIIDIILPIRNRKVLRPHVFINQFRKFLTPFFVLNPEGIYIIPAIAGIKLGGDPLPTRLK